MFVNKSGHTQLTAVYGKTSTIKDSLKLPNSNNTHNGKCA